MKITFLGTSAGESYPAIWCDCENCTYARVHGGRNIRMNTGTLIDNDILLDMNSCGFYTAARLGVSLTGVRALLATHSHPDHLTIEPLDWRAGVDDGMEMPDSQRMSIVSARFMPLPMMTVYGNHFVKEKLTKCEPVLFDERHRMCFEEIHEGVRTEAEGFAFTPLRAQHGPYGFAHSYILEKGGRTLLYALDTGGYDADMMDILLSCRYDGVVMEGTFGLSTAEMDAHMNRAKNVRFRERLLKQGCISPDTPFFLTHMTPHWTPPHDIYAPMMAKEGFTVAYDGMVAEI